MAIDSIKDKQARLHLITHTLYRHPKGLTVKEMAQMFGVTPRTIQRDIQALEDAGVPLTDDSEDIPRYYVQLGPETMDDEASYDSRKDKEARLSIIEGYFLPPLKLTLHSATAIYLAARLLMRHTDESSSHVISALRELCSALPSTIGRALALAVDQMARGREDLDARHVFETLALAWDTGRKVAIRYQSLKRSSQSSYTLHPYFIEPAERGNTYVVGYVEERDAVMTFKLDRIRHATLLNATFDEPTDSYPSEVLKQSWGIVFGEELVEVVLRFSPSVARRVDETRWHPSQKREITEDDGRILRLKISGTLEIEPWIKSWGSAVEVLAPESLRQRFIDEATALARQYRVLEG